MQKGIHVTLTVVDLLLDISRAFSFALSFASSVPKRLSATDSKSSVLLRANSRAKESRAPPAFCRCIFNSERHWNLSISVLIPRYAVDEEVSPTASALSFASTAV